MPTKSPPAGRTDHAENESFALRGFDSVCAVHLGRAGSDYEAHRPRAVALRAPLLRLFSARHLRPELADVPRPRLTCPSRPARSSDRTKSSHPSARAAWARCTAPATRGWGATWQ